MSTRPTLRAILGATPAENARQPDTALSSAWSLVVRHGGELAEAVTVRTYYSPRGSGMQPVRACIWISAPRGSGAAWRSGRGSAGGCGYHKESAAIADAVRSAGVTLQGEPAGRYRPAGSAPVDRSRPFDFGGTGDSYYRDIFEAIARAMGYRVPAGSALLIRH